MPQPTQEDSSFKRKLSKREKKAGSPVSNNCHQMSLLLTKLKSLQVTVGSSFSLSSKSNLIFLRTILFYQHCSHKLPAIELGSITWFDPRVLFLTEVKFCYWNQVGNALYRYGTQLTHVIELERGIIFFFCRYRANITLSL